MQGQSRVTIIYLFYLKEYKINTQEKYKNVLLLKILSKNIQRIHRLRNTLRRRFKSNYVEMRKNIFF